MPILADIWVHDLSEFIIEFPDGWPMNGIRWYGTAYLMGFIVAWWLLGLYYKKGRSKLNPDTQATLMTACIIGVMVGGRLGYKLLYDWAGFTADPVSIFRVWEGGMASHGGFLGVATAVFWFAWKYKVSPWRIGDYMATMAPPGLFFGRIANFINGELWGKQTDGTWGIVFPKELDVAGFSAEELMQMLPARHPSQLYASAGEGLLMIVYTQWRFWKYPNLPAGQLIGEFLIGYAIVRIVGEVFREPDAPLILGISRGMFYSIFIIFAGGVLIWRARQITKSA